MFSDSGRYIHKERFNKMLRAICSDGSDTRLCAKSIIAYRLDNDVDVDSKAIGSVSLKINTIRVYEKWTFYF